MYVGTSPPRVAVNGNVKKKKKLNVIISFVVFELKVPE